MEKEKEIEITEDQLNALYFYVNMNLDSMTEEERDFWFKILEKVDKNFYDD